MEMFNYCIIYYKNIMGQSTCLKNKLKFITGIDESVQLLYSILAYSMC